MDYTQAHGRSGRSVEYNDNYGEYANTNGPISSKYASPEQNLEARLNAELIFSNHAWVRVLNLGLFYRQPTTPASSGASTGGASVPSSPRSYDSTSPAAPTLPPPLMSSIIKSGSSTAVLQVEDLDKMEAEFLTFLDRDLATRGHNLETCWNLVVGKNEEPR